MLNRIFALPVEESLSGTISRRRYHELDIIVVKHPGFRAALTMQGAQLISWQPVAETEVLWLSPCSAFKTGIPVRGGVPLCWPWFGAASQPGLPAHGFARILPWSLCAHDENDQAVVLTFALHSNEITRRYWPYEFTLYARFRLAQHCEIELEAHGEYTSTAALHSYFHIGDLAAVQVRGLGKRYLDKVAQGREGQLTDGVQHFCGRTDRIYLEPEACSLINDKALARNIEIIHHHHRNVVVWNPGAALCASMEDMPDNGYQQFVCVETACVTQAQHSNHHSPSRLSCRLQLRGTG